MNPSGSGSGPLYTPRTRRHIMENFSPAGLHVLVVDDDPLCLMVLERMLKQCEYEVTTCNEVSCALKILRDKKNEVDVVISDVYMPDEDGFRLLEVVGLELDLPVIMISANADLNAVMKGVLHGACDYLIKPVRIEELRNIWQHVIRRKGKDYGRADFQGGINTDSPASESREEAFRKRKDVLEMPDVGVEEISSLKKPRVNWSPILHQGFVNAVNQLGVDKAVPKKILEIMNVQGLSRENVASHLQKYRLYLKRLSGAVPEPFPVASFQASQDGTTGGSMLVRPGRKGSEPVANIKGVNLGAGLVSKSGTGQSLDTGTMRSLSQFKSFQRRHAANRAQVLSAIGVGSSSYVPSSSEGGLVRMASLDLSYLPAVAQDISVGGSSSKIMDDLARISINRSIKLEDDIVLPSPVIEGIMRMQSSAVEELLVHSSSSADSGKNQGSRGSSPMNVSGSVNVEGLVEKEMQCPSDRSRVNQEGNVAYGPASHLFGSSGTPALEADVRWSPSCDPSELNYHREKLQLIQDASREVGVIADEGFDISDMSAKQKRGLSTRSGVTEMSSETFSDCGFEALIEDLGIVSQSQQQTASHQTTPEALNVDEYLQLD